MTQLRMQGAEFPLYCAANSTEVIPFYKINEHSWGFWWETFADYMNDQQETK